MITLLLVLAGYLLNHFIINIFDAFVTIQIFAKFWAITIAILQVSSRLN